MSEVMKKPVFAQKKPITMQAIQWVPGKNTPFDPVAAKRAAELGMTVITADGRDLKNLENLLDGESFVGTTVAP